MSYANKQTLNRSIVNQPITPIDHKRSAPMSPIKQSRTLEQANRGVFCFSELQRANRKLHSDNFSKCERYRAMCQHRAPSYPVPANYLIRHLFIHSIDPAERKPTTTWAPFLRQFWNSTNFRLRCKKKQFQLTGGIRITYFGYQSIKLSRCVTATQRNLSHSQAKSACK